MAVPTITSFTPTTTGPGNLVSIIGTNFTGTTVVSFGGKVAQQFVVNSATTITAVVGQGNSGSVSVTNTSGVATLAGFTFSSDPCYCNNFPSSCIPLPLIPVCDDPEYCESIFADKCISHIGTTLTNISAPEGTRLDVILSTINTKVGQTLLFNQVADYATMISIGVTPNATAYKVATDENKSLTNTVYIWWPDGSRSYLTTVVDV